MSHQNGHSQGGPHFTNDHGKDDLDKLVDADVDEDESPPRGTKNLLSRDMTLGNIGSDDHEAMRFLFKNQHEFSEAERPPPGSMIQGPIRAALAGDPTDRATALEPGERSDEHSERLVAEFRTSRSVDGFQQEKLVETRNVQRMEDARGDNPEESGGGGLFSGLFS